MVQQILDNGYGYVSNGSVYFDTIGFMKDHPYGELSGRKVDELLVETRDLKNQSDIHGGGNDLKFPHHENEIAQNVGACKCSPANYWLHTNMLLMNGKKMSKSDGNTITPPQLFTGDSPHVTKGYDPMVVKFFMLMAHYSSAKINGFKGGQLNLADISKDCLDRMKKNVNDFVFEIMGLKNELDGDKSSNYLDGLMSLIIDIRQSSRENKDWDTSDKIRDTLQELDIKIKDGKDETSWSLN